MSHWDSLGARFGYIFHSPQLLQQALTHRSYSGQNNERFEFLGDALLETIISSFLFHERGKLSEGDLTRLRATIVRGSNLAKIAQKLGVSEYLRLGSGERKSGGSRRESILADAVEALIAAVYLDSDFETCERFVLNLFAEDLERLPTSAITLKDPKTQLQEFLQGRGLPLPSYTILSESGPEHNRNFEILAQSEEWQARAVANSRKKAEQQAAEALLLRYRELHEKNKKSK